MRPQDCTCQAQTDRQPTPPEAPGMAEANIEASNGPLRDIIAEAIDPERVALRMEAVSALERSGIEADGFWIETASTGAYIQTTFLTGC